MQPGVSSKAGNRGAKKPFFAVTSAQKYPLFRVLLLKRDISQNCSKPSWEKRASEKRRLLAQPEKSKKSSFRVFELVDVDQLVVSDGL